jgi:hypothetical protein
VRDGASTLLEAEIQRLHRRQDEAILIVALKTEISKLTTSDRPSTMRRTSLFVEEPASLLESGRFSPLQVRVHMGALSETAASRLLLTNFVELSPSREIASHAAIQEFPKILWNPKVHFRVHKSSPLAPILSQINLVHTIPSYLTKINFNIIHSSTSWSS